MFVTVRRRTIRSRSNSQSANRITGVTVASPNAANALHSRMAADQASTVRVRQPAFPRPDQRPVDPQLK
jgi:hypothetical protein